MKSSSFLNLTLIIACYSALPSVADDKVSLLSTSSSGKIVDFETLEMKIASDLWGKGVQREFSYLLDLIVEFRSSEDTDPSVCIKRVIRICKASQQVERVYITYQLTFGERVFDRQIQQIATCLMQEALICVSGLSQTPEFSEYSSNPDYFIPTALIGKRYHEIKNGVIKLIGGEDWNRGKIEN